MSDQRVLLRLARWQLGCGMAVLVIVLLAIGVLLASVFRSAKEVGYGPGSAQKSLSYETEAVPELAAAAQGHEGASSGDELGAGKTRALPMAHAAEARRDIIYTAEVTIEVDDVDAALAQINQAVQEAGGWLYGRNVYVAESGDKRATITVRVPSRKFDAVLERLRNLGDLRSENTRAEDVTRQVVDLEARLRNLRREEEVMAELFKRQGKITDVLQVEKELARVRQQIEQSEAELSYLRESVAYSTITLTLNTKPSKIEQKLREWSPGYHVLKACRTLIKVVRVLVTAFIYLVIVAGPFVAAAVLVGWGIRARRRARALGTESQSPEGGGNRGDGDD